MKMSLPELTANAIKEFVAQPFIKEELPQATVNLEAKSRNQLRLNISGALRELNEFKDNLIDRINGINMLLTGMDDIVAARELREKDVDMDLTFYGSLYTLMEELIEKSIRQAQVPDQTEDSSLHYFLRAVLAAKTFSWLRRHHKNGVREFIKTVAKDLAQLGWGRMLVMSRNPKGPLADSVDKICDTLGRY